MIYLRFLWSLLRHKWFVVRAGWFLGVPLWRLIIHDWGKFTPIEFGRYARQFQGDGDPQFGLAWLHHENHHRHHWGYWIPRSGLSADLPLPMPETDVREMIADCMGAGKAYTGSWDIANWINQHGREWRLHDETERRIWAVMTEAGYFATDNCPWSWMAGANVRRLTND